MAMHLFSRLTVLLLFVSEAWSQSALATDSMTVDCVESLARIYLKAQHFQHQYVRFFALDQYGRAFEVTPSFASQCGYTIARDFWGNIELRASIISCYSQIVDDLNYTVIVRIDVSSTPNLAAPVSYVKNLTCPSYPWSAREILCETNYMEVSVGRTIPLASEGYIQDEPEDWAAAFPEAVSSNGSVWQIVFHLPSETHVMVLRDAQDAGYGINTTASRVVLRAAFNATDAVTASIGGVDFSILRATTYYKQRWMIFMLDTAVACPVDDLKFTDDAIIWSVPKTIPPLLAGANNIQASSGTFGFDLQKLSPPDVQSPYVIQNDSQATTIQIPLGAPTGYYKSHVVNGIYGITFSINMFLQNQWTDDKWGQTRHTIIKDITTPFVPQPPIITNGTIPVTKIFNATVEQFLKDVNLVFLTIGTINQTVLEANARGCIVSEFQHPNGSSSYTLEVPFDDPEVDVKVTGSFSVYTLNAVFGFNVIPQNQTFTVPVTIVVALQDIVLPIASGSCDNLYLHLVIERGNIDQDWKPYIGNLPLISQSAQMYGYLLFDNGTHFEIAVPRASTLVAYEDGSIGTIEVSIPVSLKDHAGNTRSNFTMSCSYVSKDAIACLPNGTIVVTAARKAVVQGMDLRQLVLRDPRCRPTVVTDLNATFVFNANTCGTTSRFIGNTMIYENNVFYYGSGVAGALYNLRVSCNYRINDTVKVSFTAEDNVSPTGELGYGSLALVMRLSKDPSYSNFYNDREYPVLKFLQQPLYFEVELLYTQDAHLAIFLENCWATFSADRSSTPRWDVIINSCENAADDYKTIFHPVNIDSRVRIPGHLKRFEVKTFTFRQNAQGKVYFHCSVVICNAALPSSDQLCSRPCIPDAQRRGRSVDTGGDLHGYVSSGSVQFLDENITQDTEEAH